VGVAALAGVVAGAALPALQRHVQLRALTAGAGAVRLLRALRHLAQLLLGELLRGAPAPRSRPRHARCSSALLRPRRLAPPQGCYARQPCTAEGTWDCGADLHGQTGEGTSA